MKAIKHQNRIFLPSMPQKMITVAHHSASAAFINRFNPFAPDTVVVDHLLPHVLKR
jgi:hypothetical protein